MGANYLRRFILTTLLALQLDYSAGQCLGTTLSLTATTSLQSISSPNYPHAYYNDYRCEWSITSALGEVVVYVFEDNIERSYDQMMISYFGGGSTNTLYDSDQDYHQPYVGVSTGSNLMVTFNTDYSVSYGGFLIYYIGVSAINACDQLTATGTAQQLTYIYNRVEYECDFTITSGNLVKITVEMVRSTVKIIDGGTQTPINTVGSVYISTSNSLTIRGTDGHAFVITYEDVSSGSNNLITTEAPVPTTECIGSKDITATDTVQILTSESYPGAYPNNRFCSVLVEAQNDQDSVYLDINDYHVVGGDYLWMYDGPSSSFNQFWSIETYASYASSGFRVYIEFTTNEYGVGRGFNISLYSRSRVDPLFGVSYTPTGTYTATSMFQSITSPNYPNEYDNYLDVYWLIIKSDQDENIRLEFHTIEVEDAFNCIYDKVTFYDGNLVTDPVLLEVCGYDPMHIEDNTGLYILVRFQTDSSVTAHGFRIDFNTQSVPAQSQSSDEAVDEGMPSWTVAVIVIVVIVVSAISITACIYIRKSTARVAAGKVEPPKQEKRTTQQLLTEITTKYGAKLNEPKKKVYRKRQQDVRPPQPKPTGPSVNVHVTVISHPQPNPQPNIPPHQPPIPQPFGINDPVYPPLYMGSSVNGPPSNITPVLTNIPQSMPTAPVDDPAYPAVIPSPYAYYTPAEARNQGMHQ